MYFFVLVGFYCSGRVVSYVRHGWCMPDGAFSSGVIVNNSKLFGRIDLNLLTWPASFLPRRVGSAREGNLRICQSCTVIVFGCGVGWFVFG